jgi:glycerol kinase
VIDIGTIESKWELDAEYKPIMKRGERERLYAEWTRAVERSRNWIVPEIG